MNRSVSQAARMLGVDTAQVKKWAFVFKDYLSAPANPKKGQTRSFNETDILVLAYVWYYWEENPDIEAIKIGLNREEHCDQQFIEHLYLHTPLLQERPDELDETWRHGILLNGGSINERLELARNYRHVAKVLLDIALNEGEPFAWACPVLFSYRHTLELYLQIIGEISERTHSLETCVRLVESRHGMKISSPVREWILELDKIDPSGTAFRYADDNGGALPWQEHWIDFGQFKFAMDRVFDMLDRAILKVAEREKLSGRGV
jgi:hypothetical protein